MERHLARSGYVSGLHSYLGTDNPVSEQRSIRQVLRCQVVVFIRDKFAHIAWVVVVETDGAEQYEDKQSSLADLSRMARWWLCPVKLGSALMIFHGSPPSQAIAASCDS